jgi:hypothetical protein
MSYLWQEFNIKTFSAETLVFRDGVFCPELSEYECAKIDTEKNLILIQKTSKLPVHIIYIGEIAGKNDVNIDINCEKSRVFMTMKIFNKKPAFLNIFIKNTGKKNIFDGKIIAKNTGILEINETGEHKCSNTGIFLKNRIIAGKNSETKLTGIAKIEQGAIDCDSDISFSVLADESAKITMVPTQYINAVPKSASHSASIYKPTENQIMYLRTAGLSGNEIKQIMEDAFMEI